MIAHIDNYGLIWIAVGLVGQAVFCMRFVVQWIATERHKKSVVPVAFWYLSLVGSVILLAYAIRRRDPVFAPGYCLTLLVYLRNLHFIRRGARARVEATVPADDADDADDVGPPTTKTD